MSIKDPNFLAREIKLNPTVYFETDTLLQSKGILNIVSDDLCLFLSIRLMLFFLDPSLCDNLDITLDKEKRKAPGETIRASGQKLRVTNISVDEEDNSHSQRDNELP